MEFQQENEIKTSSESSENITEANNVSMDDTSSGCENCGSLCIEENYKFKLCKECRDKLSKRTIPIQIKLVSILLIMIILFSLSKFLHSINMGVEYERGLRAEEALKYETALNHYINVVKEYPESDKALVRLYVAYYNCGRIEEAFNVYDQIAESPASNNMKKILVDEVNETTDKLDTYYCPTQELYDKLIGLKNPKTEDIINILKPAVDKNPDEVYGAYYLANLYFDMKNYTEAGQVLSKVISRYPDFSPGYMLQAAVCRELGKYEEAVEYCNKELEHNVEDIGAYINLSKIELKQGNNAKGLEYAKMAYEIDNKDPYIAATLAMAYHFNNMFSERDKYYKIYQDSNIKDEYTDNLLKSIFDGTQQWQNQI
ncbi:MAG: tetratricopeptide repeat protein [Clostridiaceae bacterium]